MWRCLWFYGEQGKLIKKVNRRDELVNFENAKIFDRFRNWAMFRWNWKNGTNKTQKGINIEHE